MFSLSKETFSEEKMEIYKRKVLEIAEFAGISPFENKYEGVYDFSPAEGNFKVLSCPNEQHVQIWQQPPVLHEPTKEKYTGGEVLAQTDQIQEVEDLGKMSSNFTSNFGIPIINEKKKTGAVVLYKFAAIPPVIMNYQMYKVGVYVVACVKAGNMYQLSLSAESDVCAKFGGERM